MRRSLVALAIAGALALGCGTAFAQSPNTDTYFYTPGGGGVNGSLGMCLNAQLKAVPCSNTGALPSPTSLQAATTGGATPFHLIALATNNAQLVSAGAHTVYSAQLGGVGAAPAYLKIYDKATTPACNTDVPIKTLIIPAASTAANGAGSNVPIPLGVRITLGLGICVTGGIADNDNTSVAAATWIINLDYQ